MATRPILLFLHGVSGDAGPDDTWAGALSASLTRAGYPDLSQVCVVAPKYPATLRATDDREPLPKLTIRSPRGDLAQRYRRDFERRTSAVEAMLGQADSGDGWFAGDLVVGVAADLAFEQARHYTKDATIRAQVLNRVLRELPSSGRVVIVGHSLGSVIAADLVRRLPVGLDVAGMVTIGSPLAHPKFHVDKLNSIMSSPPTNLAWWVNLWSTQDPVTAHKGVSSAFPWVVDLRITTPGGRHSHDAHSYLRADEAARAIGYGLFGSQSKALATRSKGADIPLDYPEIVALLALRFAHHVGGFLEDDRADRWAGALRQVQASTAELIRARNDQQGRPMASRIAELSIDVADPYSMPRAPQVVAFLTKDEAVIPLLTIAATNVLAPFEIEVSKDKRRMAMEALTLDMGVGSALGSNVFVAIDRARAELKGGPNWAKWAALTVGAAAVVAATGGLALAAAPGVAGAAAITSALAAFGPGGMIGGLLTAGTLVSAGSGGIAFGLASATTTAATVEAVVESQLALAILRQLEGLDQDALIWSGLVELGVGLRRERARQETWSDESSPTLKEISRKLLAVDRALEYLDVQGLGPV